MPKMKPAAHQERPKPIETQRDDPLARIREEIPPYRETSGLEKEPYGLHPDDAHLGRYLALKTHVATKERSPEGWDVYINNNANFRLPEEWFQSNAEREETELETLSKRTTHFLAKLGKNRGGSLTEFTQACLKDAQRQEALARLLQAFPKISLNIATEYIPFALDRLSAALDEDAELAILIAEGEIEALGKNMGVLTPGIVLKPEGGRKEAALLAHKMEALFQDCAEEIRGGSLPRETGNLVLVETGRKSLEKTLLANAPGVVEKAAAEPPPHLSEAWTRAPEQVEEYPLEQLEKDIQLLEKFEENYDPKEIRNQWREALEEKPYPEQRREAVEKLLYGEEKS
ncbi:hypothetical protein GF360_00590 [candidate division WWE3 bacterium]|nr:hypothetical protein [candidate division WWE3 bacterium]